MSRGGDPYAVLGVPRAASDAEVRAAFRAAVRRLHPDGRTATEADGAAMAELIDAWRQLRDPATRADLNAPTSDPACTPRPGPSFSTRQVGVLFAATMTLTTVVIIVFIVIAFAQSG